MWACTRGLGRGTLVLEEDTRVCHAQAAYLLDDLTSELSDPRSVLDLVITVGQGLRRDWLGDSSLQEVGGGGCMLGLGQGSEGSHTRPVSQVSLEGPLRWEENAALS